MKQCNKCQWYKGKTSLEGICRRHKDYNVGSHLIVMWKDFCNIFMKIV